MAKFDLQARLATARKTLWHFRKGGLAQVREHNRRSALQAFQPMVIAPRTHKLNPFARTKTTRSGQPLGPDFVRSLGPWPTETTEGARRPLKVGVIMDAFTTSCFAPEWEQVALGPNTWPEQLETEKLDFVLIESAWHGNNDQWRYGLSGKPWDKLRNLLAACHERQIPTVFWNKEDPAHYDDFIETARLFDHVFTTDSNCIPRYQTDLGHDRVYPLPFAAQPQIHNPVRPEKGYASRDIAFAGTYFTHKFPERRAQMDILLGGADDVSAKMDTGLEIYSREMGTGDPRYQFPEPLDKRVIGSVDYQRMLSAYRAYKVFLNVNSVTDSPSMCARRIFEILACNTSVVSTPSAAIRNFFPETELAVVNDREEAGTMLRALVGSPLLRDRMNHLAARRIWNEHTYSHRAETILTTIGLQTAPTPRPTASAIVSTIRPEQIDHILKTVADMNGIDGLPVQLCLLTHGFEAPNDLEARARDLGLENTIILTGDPNNSLGTCLNQLIEAADGTYIAKIDDDDWYGPHYLTDQIHALNYSGAQIVGKQAHYAHLESLDATALISPEREHRYTHFLAGPTLVTTRETALAHPFENRTTGEDTAFLTNIGNAGGRIYSTDRFNFLRRRSTHNHTWNISDEEVLRNGQIVAYGKNLETIMF
ncbi:hypothetical protein BK816_00365 [Boudabousia tangfeifanii]|uniref:Uncharacterized protein n=1 Tax=Boudabousia tangfeifanii TaxID=1912795 RepID=A0A1D9MI04_9ACTO|nr:glycosyltransferase [Boudabousia tangfeifanii]AOZ71932.1 hypothetical protein BK816_00365 [Boudabousia tangfeifanii]